MSKKPLVIITGSGRGIGAATAIECAKEGYYVCVNYLANEQAAHRVVDVIKHEGGDAVAIQADVSCPSDVERLFESVDQLPYSLTALVNNAGTLSQQMRLDQMDVQRWEHVFRQNVFSAFLCSKQAVLRMSTKYQGSGGVIVNVSSASAYLGSPNEYIDYAATKGAMDSMTRGLALEVAVEGIRVNGVRPALIDTEIHALGGAANRVHEKVPNIPMQRVGTSQDVAEAVCFLLSDRSSFITGKQVDVTGGL
jgi:NAD(P)-dependent dehydrogenase (short-subunit alcohol dehydrogenase family)